MSPFHHDTHMFRRSVIKHSVWKVSKDTLTTPISICSAVREGAAHACDKNQNMGKRSISGDIIPTRRADFQLRKIWGIMPRHSLLLQHSQTGPDRRIHQINDSGPDKATRISSWISLAKWRCTLLWRANTWNRYLIKPKSNTFPVLISSQNYMSCTFRLLHLDSKCAHKQIWSRQGLKTTRISMELRIPTFQRCVCNTGKRGNRSCALRRSSETDWRTGRVERNLPRSTQGGGGRICQPVQSKWSLWRQYNSWRGLRLHARFGNRLSCFLKQWPSLLYIGQEYAHLTQNH